MPDRSESETVVKGAAPKLRDNAAATYELRVTEGPARGAVTTVGPNDPPVLVGQSPKSTFVLADDRVSRRHFSVEVGARGLHVIDLDSTNGTFVNGVLVDAAHARSGDVIGAGDSVLSVSVVEPTAGRSLAALTDDVRFGRLFGGSPAMRKIYPLCARLAASNVSVILEGETGTGKELLAEVLHESGPRASGPFVVFDCTAVPASLVESTLMGHEKGAFTSASSAQRGLFEQAHGGTLLIDEIGDLDIALQPKLLRALEQGSVRRLGGDRAIPVDVRVLAATRRDLEREIQAGRFRDDLFYRLAVARIELPALRNRREDIGLLSRHFWRRLGDDARPFPAELLERFESYPWPGNVRELRNAIAHHLALGDLAGEWPATRGRPFPDDSSRTDSVTATAGAADMIEETLGLDLPLPRARERVVQAFERQYVERVLARHGGNVTRAAAASGIARRSFYAVLARGERDG